MSGTSGMSPVRNLKRVFGFKRRITRGDFWLRAIGIWIVFAGCTSLLGGLPQSVWILNVLTLWALLATCVQRLHDRNRSGWWMLLTLLPVLGALWLIWQLAFKRGVSGDNRWGVDRLERTPDFLVVR